MSLLSNAKENPKRMFYVFDVLFALALIIAMTFCELAIDPTKVDWGTWAANTAIQVIIQLSMIAVMTAASKDASMGKEEGLYQRALTSYNETYVAIRERGLIPTFSQFFFWFRNKENFENRVNALMDAEFDGLEAVYVATYCKLEDIALLLKGTIKKEKEDGTPVYLNQISRDKAEIIKKVLSGEYDVAQSSYAYYLSVASGNDAPRSTLDQSSYFEGKARASRNVGTAVKVIVFLLTSVVISMITIKEASSTDPDAQVRVWFNLISRICSMVAGGTSGWLSGIKEVKFLAASLLAKQSVLHEYIVSVDKGSFVPKTYEELAKESYEAQESQLGKEELPKGVEENG